MKSQYSQDEIEKAVGLLTRAGFDTHALRAAVDKRVADTERGEPTELDRMYSLPVTAPAIADHFVEGDRLPAVLDCRSMWPGYHYTLSPGQRRYFREFMGLTPAQTVTVKWVQKFPGTDHPASFAIESDVHLDPRVRRHVLVAAVIHEVGKFFFTAAQMDAEAEVDDAEDDGTTVKKGKKGKKVTVKGPISLADILAQMEKETLTQ